MYYMALCCTIGEYLELFYHDCWAMHMYSEVDAYVGDEKMTAFTKKYLKQFV